MFERFRRMPTSGTGRCYRSVRSGSVSTDGGTQTRPIPALCGTLTLLIRVQKWENARPFP
jgi:hypothetical protein